MTCIYHHVDQPCPHCCGMDVYRPPTSEEYRRMLGAFESIALTATHMLDPVRRRGPGGGENHQEMRRTFERRRTEELALQKERSAGSGDVANAEEGL